ncbi:10805_t:CDS:2 [Gigaspora margarita]|uniref:10805_t:CDS:1 n=1 Tax=Gigaspora margarita TaxID=4874 RepID=A0ABN7V9Y0_GIGMA|nr:10805_t:CDS:2 [Gigaspora margarita]
MPKILQLHVDQMNKAVMYNGQKLNFDDPFNLILDMVENEPIELEYDFCQIRIDELLEEIDHSLIAEVWKFTQLKITSNIPLFSNVTKSWNTMFIEPPEQTAAKVIGQKQSIKGTLLGLACKCCASYRRCANYRRYASYGRYDIVKDNDFLEYKEVIRNDQFVEHMSASETTYFDVQNPLCILKKVELQK